MFKVNNLIYNCEFKEELISYNLSNNNEISFVLNGEFNKDVQENKFTNINLKLEKISIENNDISNKISKDKKNKIIQLILEDIVDIYEIEIGNFDYDLRYNNSNQIEKILKDKNE